MKKSLCEEQIYQSVYEKKVNSLYNFIYFKCMRSDLAQDIVQNAFIKLWENCSKIDYEKANAFLYKVANNLFINDLKHKKVVLEHQKSKGERINIQDPQFEMEEKEYMLKLEKALSNLTEQQREAFLMNRIEGKKYYEIAEILGISIKAVEKRIHLALKSLKEIIHHKI